MQSTHSEWRQFLRQHLPAYMVPTLFVEVPAMPLTPAGKVDRKALPDPLRSAERAGGQPPATPVEKKVAAIWSEVLNGAAVHRDDNFFDIGGHSLASMQVIARLESEFGVRILPASLTLETLEQVAARCQAAAVVAHEGDAVNAAVAAAAPEEGTAAADQPPASGLRSRLVNAFKNVVSRE
jgi:acyl carrier protein